MSNLWHDIQARRLAEIPADSFTDLQRVAGVESRAPLSSIVNTQLRHRPGRTVPERIRWEVWERDDFTCQHCGARRFLTIDHKYPFSRGGPHDPDNLQTLCRRCNSRKGDSVE